MFNWSIRYAKILRDNPGLFDPANSVVEVGSGPLGIAQFIRRPVVGIEPNPMNSQSEYLTIQQGSILNLPYADGEIDYILCMDVMEHLPRQIRSAAIHELARVAKRKVIISCPCHHWADKAEAQLRTVFDRFQIAVPQWLSEHLELGLPSVNDLVVPIVETGRPFKIEGNETISQHYAGILLDWMFGELTVHNDRRIEKSVADSPIYGSEWDLYYSFTFTLAGTASAPIGEFDAAPLRRSQPDDFPVDGRAAIYSVYHKDFPVAHLGSIRPIFSGPAALTAAPGQLTDKLIGGTSLPNARYSELSAIYKIFRDGPRTSVVGVTHYRRHFDFRGFQLPASADLTANRETRISVSDVSQYSQHFNSDAALKAVEAGALIIAIPHNTVETIFDHYCMYHNTNDYLSMFNRSSRSPLFIGFLEQLESRSLYANNMFIASWELFSEICSFWFNYLRTFEGEIAGRAASSYQQRDLAFLSERIFDAWVRYRKSIGTVVIEVPIFFIDG